MGWNERITALRRVKWCLSDQSNPLISIACLLSNLWRTAVIFEELALTFILLSIAGTGRPVNASLSFMDP